MRKILLGIIVLLGAPASVSATQYYVDGSSALAKDTNAGTALSTPWKTIQKAAATMVAGDTVNIVAGTYNEGVAMKNSGTATARITYQSHNGGKVVIPQAFTVSGNYIVVKGLEISGDSMTINGSYCQILDNYIHDAGTNGLFIHGTYLLLRGNKVLNNGSSWGGQITTSWNYTSVATHHVVFEKNDVGDPGGKGEDLMQYMAHDMIIRDNVFHDLGSNGRHNDIYQSGGGEYNIWMINNRFERLADVQYFMIGPSGDHDHVWRGNLFYGATGWGFNGTPAGMRVMNNTFSLLGSGGNWGVGGCGTALNNIFSPPGSDGHHGALDYNCVSPVPCCSDKGPHDLWGVDPKFVDLAKRDFRLQSSSPCIDAGTFITTATSAGSGTQLPVADARLFVDGFGIAEGDAIQLKGQTQVAKITSINYGTNTLTLDRTLTWTQGQGVSVPYVGSAPDIGALEYGSPALTAAPAAPTNLKVQ